MLKDLVSRRKRRGLALSGALLFAAAALAAGCGGSDNGSDSSGTGASADLNGKSVFIVSCAPSDPYCATYNSTLQNALKAKGADVHLATNPKDSALEQQQLQQAISQQPDLIINLPTDSSAIAQPYAQAKQAGISVIATVNPISPEALANATSQVYANNVQMGQAAADNIIAGLKELGKTTGNIISITGNAASLTTTQREDAFEAKLASDAPGLKLVGVEDGNWDPIKTQTIASQLFAANQSKGGIQGAYGMSGLQATGIIRSADQAGLPVGVKAKGLIVSGSNCGPVSVKSIQDGILFGDASETPSGDANAVIPFAEKVLAGESIPQSVATPIEPITQANVDKWIRPCTY
jgi:ABC-type sugar transport system substrate-binding protein